MVLGSHPGVREAAVVGIPDRRYGEVVRAVVVPADPAAPPAAEDLRRLVGERLAHFKVPAEVLFVDELPRNPSGKILRRRLKDT
jgi:acyl-coenzyme A synthetase/AMP-(fatty) acid ligase